MPIFEDVCQECRHRFELLVQGSTVPTCPSCKAAKVEKQMSAFAVGESASWASSSPDPCGACGDPRGPGSCALD